MSNYFRVTAYHEKANISVIVDSNGYFKQLWELSAFMIRNGFKVLEIGVDSKFLDGNIPRAEQNTESLVLRACSIGKPSYSEREQDGKRYNAVQVETRQYLSER